MECEAQVSVRLWRRSYGFLAALGPAGPKLTVRPDFSSPKERLALRTPLALAASVAGAGAEHPRPPMRHSRPSGEVVGMLASGTT